MKILSNLKWMLVASAVGLSFFSCAVDSDSGSSEKKESFVFDSRVKGLDTIFETSKLGETKLTVKRSEWNTLLSNYKLNEKNEDCVHADYSFKKGDYSWDIKDVGFRIRGNTSRCSPQIDEETYQQAHFKIDFEEWPVIVDGVETEREEKMGGVMKGVILKRCKDDHTYVREVFCYNYFRQCGVWTSPRAGYTRLLIDIVEDNGSVEKVDFGVYEMIENIDKQFLKARTAEENGGNFNGNKGNLWKCTTKSGNRPNFKTGYNDNDFGVEDIKLDPSETSYEFSYDLKTNKDKLSKAKTEIKSFIDELNALSDSDPAAIKTWYESKMDVDLFIKTYAINVILGMWDDYWCNTNNFYFYFDKEGKAYFIPYDYDNALGTNMWFVAARQDPLAWGSVDDGLKPLIQKMLKVPEYVSLYKKYLRQYSSSDSGFDFAKASKTITGYQNLIRNYIAADKYSKCKLHWKDTTPEFVDEPAGWGDPKGADLLFSGDELTNYFKARQKAIDYYVSDDSGKPDPSDLSAVVPVSNVGENSYKFVFRPSDYDIASFTGDVELRGDMTGWVSEPIKMEYDADSGTYSVTCEAFPNNKYKFYIKSSDTWVGAKEFKYNLPATYAQQSANMNFIIPE